ncbi:MAG: tetratricopeptide repeat protein, partial [Rhodothermales bacterium]|nr:tetratricopeptide repeat protein [Rhodothermales bacterium]
VASLLGNLGLIEKREGRLQEAELHVRESIAILERLEGTEERVADATRNLATILRDQGRLEETRAMYQKHVAMRRAIAGDTSVAVSAALAFLGAFEDQLGDYEDAATTHSESLQILLHLYGPRHQYAAMAMSNLANSYRMLGRYDEAADLFRESLEIRKALYGPSHYRVATVLRLLGNVSSERGDEDAGLEYFRQALAIRRENFGAEHKETANSLNDVAASLEELGRIDEAAQVLDEARRVWDAIDDHDNGRSRTSYLTGRIMLARGRLDESETWLRGSVAERQLRFGDDHWLTAASRSLLGDCLVSQGRLQEAEELLLEAHASLADGSSVPEKIELGKALERLVRLYEHSGAGDKASPYKAELEGLARRVTG